MGWQRLWQDPEIAKDWAERPPVEEVVEMADRLAQEGRGRVLDIGCGVGRHTLYLAARGCAVTGIDHAPTALATCRRHLHRAGLTAALQEMDMTALAFPEESFDGAISTQVIHHAPLATIRDIVGQITRVLAPGGYFVFAAPTPEHEDWGKGEEIEPGTWVDPNHREGPVPHHFCTKEELYDLLQAYEIISLEKERWPGDDRVRVHWRVLAQKK